MNTLLNIFKAHKEYKELTEKAEKLRVSHGKIISDKYTACLHFHYSKPFISLWVKDDSISKALFKVGEEGLVTLMESSNCDLTTITEMSEVISGWLEEEV